MKVNSINRGVFSILLVIVMLTTCWVFTAPKADAASAGSYQFKFEINETGNGCDNEKDYKITYKYKSNNGTGGESGEQTAFDVGDKSQDGWSDTKTVGGFITYVYAEVFQNNVYSQGDWGCKVYVKNSSGGWTTCADFSIGSRSSRGTVKKSTTSITNKPAINSVTISSGVSSANVPTDNTTLTCTAFSGSVKDQYSVAWYQAPTWSVTSHTGVSMSNTGASDSSSLKLAPNANAASNYSVTVTASCGDKSATKSVSVTVFKYNVTFYDSDGTTVLKAKQSNIAYNGSATAPSNPPAKYTSTTHQTFKQWDTTYTNLKDGPQTVTVKATYNNSANHSGYVVSNDSEDDNKHNYKCAYCDYNPKANHTYSGTWTSVNDAQHKDTCGTANCGHIKYANHTYGETTFTFASDGKTATASRTCSGCNHTQTDDATVTSEVKIAANCTTKGTTTYTATSPFSGESNVKDTVDKQDIAIAPNNHNYTAQYIEAAIKDEAGCVTNATYYPSCSRCNAVNTNGEPFEKPDTATGHSYGEWETKTPATCVATGVKERVCPNCSASTTGHTETATIPIDLVNGHDKYEVRSEPGNGIDSTGAIYFACHNCENYWSAAYDDSQEKYVSEDEYSSPESAISNSEAVPAPEFNSYYNEYLDYFYDERGASLKIAEPFDFSNSTTRQGLRFTSSLHIPDSESLPESEVYGEIVDFGFVYSQTELIGENINNLYIGAPNVYKMSVSTNNAGKGAYDGTNWTGVSSHTDDYGGITLTFNLVLNVKAYNWIHPYCARSFVIYNYNGHTYTVYDSDYSSRSVEYIARAVIEHSYQETEKVVNYCQNKILTPIDEGWIVPPNN